MSALNVGIIGCGNISAAYLRLVPLFADIKTVAVADMNMDAANARAGEFGVEALTVDALLAKSDIDIIVNLTIPAAHFEVSKSALEAGKHVYSEKPFVLSVADGMTLAKMAAARNLRIGSAPDTFLGGAHQHARAILDSGALGKINSGTAHVMSHGMEHWHPNPDFFYLPGGGPVLDIGPYYVTNLIQLLGPVRRLAALANCESATRTITSQPRKGETIPVKTPTNIHALLEFKSGATITLGASWDVHAHRHENMELYGSEGSLYVPDPNFFGGDVMAVGADGAAMKLPAFDHPFAKPNWEGRANYRAAGLADMAAGINAGRPHRCSLELALHAVDVMTAILESGERGEFINLKTDCTRPDALDGDAAAALLA